MPGQKQGKYQDQHQAMKVGRELIHKPLRHINRPETMAEKTMVKNGLKKAFINAFILLHLLIIVIWGLPASSFRSTLARHVEKYVIWTGLWHSWDMFSPDPLSLNFNVTAEITYRDGSTKIWEFPRMEKMSIGEKFQKERFRKWRERTRIDSYRLVWDDTARYVARLNNTNPANPPVTVVLERHWDIIAPPKKGDYQPLTHSFELKNHYKYEYYQVQEGDL